MKLAKCKKQYVLLLEVVIAMMLVALCAIPLLAPQAFLLARQQRFLHEVDLDHLVNLLYADVTLQLYRNEVPWANLINKTPIEITPDMISRTGFTKPLPFKGTYTFTHVQSKPKKDSPFAIFLFTLEFEFSNVDKKALKYLYKIFLIRHIETGDVEVLESDTVDPEEDENSEEEGNL